MTRCAGLLLCLGFVLAAGPIYTVTDLGSLGGGSTQAFAVNNAGVAVGTSRSPSQTPLAFLSQDGVATVLDGPGLGSQANGINNGGDAAGTVWTSGGAQGGYWTNGVFVGVGSLGGSQTYALAINDKGSVAGGSTLADGQGRAFLYGGGAMTNLGTLPGGTWSAAYGVNNAGTAVGYSDAGGSSFRAFRWTASGGMEDLGTLGGAHSYAFGVNSAGAVVGTSATGSGYLHAFLWAGGEMRDLGALAGGLSSFAYGINASGDIVGYSILSGSGANRALGILNGIMYDLNSLILPDSGWTLQHAYAVSDSGFIVGSGQFGGEQRAFRLNPYDAAEPGAAIPEPGTFQLLIAAGMLLIGVPALRELAKRR